MTQPTTPTRRSAALAYARIGWHVLPIWPIRDGRCACGNEACPSPGKHPIARLVPNGLRDATTDGATIRRWWTAVPDANIATPDWLAIDVDAAGAEAWDDLLFDEGLPDTPVCLTPGGGQHVYLRPAAGDEPSNKTGSLPAGIDVRGHWTGYTLLPPSNHLAGRDYAWEPSSRPDEVDVAPLPDWLAEMLSAGRENGDRPGPALPVVGDIVAGGRNDTLTSLAGTMRRRGMSKEAILAALTEENGARCVPPLPADEVATIARSVARYEPADPVPTAANGRAPAQVQAPAADELPIIAPPFGPDGEPPKGWTVALANAVCATEHFAKSDAGELHYYTDGRYIRRGADHIKRMCKRLLVAWGRESIFTSYRANEVTAYIAADAPFLWTTPPAGRLNVANGILDLSTRELQPHTPVWLSTLQLPVEYEPGAVPVQWLRFIGEWFPADSKATPWELLAWLISPDLQLQKAILLLGTGENGKSRFLAAVKAFLGAHNTSAMALQQIETSRWGTHHLNGKLANICPDLPSQHLETSSTFKALTGGDSVQAERKFGEQYEYTPFVRLLFSANQPPQSKDASKAFFRRWLVIPFDATFAADKKLPAPEIDERLSRPEELSGALNFALDALPAVRKQGFTITESMREAHREFHEVTDPITVWLETNAVESPEAYVAKGDLLKAYNRDARANGWTVQTARQFAALVRDWKPGIEDGQKRVGVARPTVWYGISLRADMETEFA